MREKERRNACILPTEASSTLTRPIHFPFRYGVTGAPPRILPTTTAFLPTSFPVPSQFTVLRKTPPATAPSSSSSSSSTCHRPFSPRLRASLPVRYE